MNSMSKRLILNILSMFRSLRWRLTAWYVALLCGLLLIFSTGTYIAVSKLLLDNLDDLLASQAKLIVETINLNDRELAIQNDALQIGRNTDDHLTRLYGADGTRLFDNDANINSAELNGAVHEALDGKQDYDLISDHGGLRVLTFPIKRGSQVVGVLQVGLSLEDVNDTMHALLRGMLVLAPAMLLLASGGGFFLANRALAPIDNITRTAQQISAEDFNRRIGLRGLDEVGRLAHTFDDMIARLQLAFEQQRRFTADASHELRTPLTAMIGQIDVALERQRDADSYRATLTTVREQAQRLGRLANDLLFLARSDTHPKPAARETIDLAQLLPAIVAQVEPLAQARDQRLDLHQTSPSSIVQGNEDDLIRLFLNLLDNAIRYTPSGGRICVRCDQQDTQVMVSVADTGQGIAPEHLPHLFDRFFRVDRGRSRAHGGSGLGLAIAQNIVRAHGGKLLVESALGQGSTFTAVLPEVG